MKITPEAETVGEKEYAAEYKRFVEGRQTEHPKGYYVQRHTDAVTAQLREEVERLDKLVLNQLADLGKCQAENERLKGEMQKPRVCDSDTINELRSQLAAKDAGFEDVKAKMYGIVREANIRANSLELERDALQRRVEGLDFSLRQYGEHRASCQTGLFAEPRPCTCGLEAALNPPTA